jgi:hypothetical protein
MILGTKEEKVCRGRELGKGLLSSYKEPRMISIIALCVCRLIETGRTGDGGLDNPACESGASFLCVHYSLLVTLHKPKYVNFNKILVFIFNPEKERNANVE